MDTKKGKITVRVPPQWCAYPKEMSKNTCTYTKAATWRKSNYREDQTLQKKKVTRGRNFQIMKRAIK
jgi:hypothetical protein